MLPVPVPHVRPRPDKAIDTVAKTVSAVREVVARRLPIDLMLRRSLTPPLRDEHVEEAISLITHDFMKMTAQQKAFLQQVASGDGTVNPKESEVQLRSHMLLGHLNGQDWYEVHPLPRKAFGLP